MWALEDFETAGRLRMSLQIEATFRPPVFFRIFGENGKFSVSWRIGMRLI